MIKYLINRPIFSSVIAIVIIVAGLVTVLSLPIAQFPEITPPTVNVSAVYPGADAQTVAQTIGVPIEEQVNGVDDMIYMSSTSSSNGSYNLTITFKVGTDIDMATVLVQNRVNQAQGSLPSSVVQQGITTHKQSTNIVMFISLTSDNPLYDGLYLSNYAQLNLVNQLSRVNGVGSVSAFGAGNYSMRIWMDPERMRIRGLDPVDVYNAIAAQNRAVSAGGIGVPPIARDIDYQFTLSVDGRLKNADEFENIVLKVLDDGSFLRLKDVASVEVGSESYNVSSTQSGKQNASIAIYQQPGANALEVSKAVRKELDRLSAYFPKDVKYDIVLDTTDFVKASINEILKTFIETLLLVVLVIILFLQSFRAMILPVIVIPISIIGTFAVMKLFGFSINTLSLFGLVLAIAIVVDDAIVVVENVTRYMLGGEVSDIKSDKDNTLEARREAVYKAMKDIIGPVIGIVIVMLAVFVPTAFIGGITGELYKQFALTIAVATLISGFVSLAFTPAMCAIFINGEIKQSDFFIFRWFNNFYNWLVEKYVLIIKKLLRHHVAVALIFFIVLGATIFLFIKIPTSFVPQEDEGYFMVSVQLPPGASLDRTTKVTDSLGKILTNYPQVSTYLTINGMSIMGGGTESNSATLFVMLKNWKERKTKSSSSFSIVDKFNIQCSSIQDAQIFAVSPSAIPGLGQSGGLQVEIEDINNLGTVQLQEMLNVLMSTYYKVPQISMLNTQFQANTPKYYLNVDRDKLQMMGISISDFFNTLSYYMGSAYVNDYIELGRIFQVNIEASAESRRMINDVLKLSVKNSTGNLVPFSSFVTPVEQIGINNISRYNLYTAASVIVITNPKYSSMEGISAMDKLLNESIGNEFGYEWTSVAYQELEAGSSIIWIFILAIIIVILVLSAQYESLKNPIAVLMGVPFAILGALLGMIVMSLSISVYTQIGIILLIALSSKNAILIVQFAIDYYNEGKSAEEAAIEAGRVRFRPILMTSFAFILGVLPLMFASGAGAESRIYLGTAVVFGMLFNTIFGTLFIPSYYVLMNYKRKK